MSTDSAAYLNLDEDDFDFLPMPGSFPRYVVQQPHDAPIRRLPAEILGNVFVQCLEDTFILPHIYDAPLLLCRVCSAWRRVSISTPMLWTSVLVQLPPKSTLASLQYGLHCWLLRSGALPLTIRIDSHPVYSLPGEFFGIFAPSFTRWRNLKLHVPSMYLSHLLRHSQAWASQLTRLTLSSDASVNDCLDILGRCPKLQDAFFARLLENSDPITRPLILLPELHTLKLITGQDVFSSLDFLEVPLLRNLDIVFYFPQPWDKQRLLSLFSRSNCPIERLVIEGLVIPPEDLVECVQHTTSLLQFHVSISSEDLLPKKVRDILARRRLQTLRVVEHAG